MSDLIRRLAVRVGRALVRAGSTRPPATAPVAGHRTAFRARPVPPAPLPRHRSPYGLVTVLDGGATRAVRPYVVAHERQWRLLHGSASGQVLAPSAPGRGLRGPNRVHGPGAAR
ncbi:hypothetical protein JS756_34430 [Streptomyces actuosus]|uniref:Uncharacterized protein n=1 Tax=Streptomyces actuosus TaxID=1885 RepID=A0ABS2W0Z8_STRAS|nr:hypothetical protein [Streptomyces actuosus]MBN0049092.1 hypothetical protein [Streptomyces actuosus]